MKDNARTEHYFYVPIVDRFASQLLCAEEQDVDSVLTAWQLLAQEIELVSQKRYTSIFIADMVLIACVPLSKLARCVCERDKT